MSIKDRTTSAFVMLPANMIEQINDYKNEKRLKTRNEAIRRLIQIGLESEDSRE